LQAAPKNCKEDCTFDEKNFVRLSGTVRKLLLLAPAAFVYGWRNQVTIDAERHGDLLRQMQSLRGEIYLADGAIRPAQLTDGRHVDARDRQSWHLLVVDEADSVLGCVRYKMHSAGAGFSDLVAAESSLASCKTWGKKARTAIEDELTLSRTMDLPFVEIGGWALDEGIRGSVEALRMILGVYAVSREMGGAIGLATATTRHSSSSILRRLGGHSLTHEGEEVPPYEDEHYNCKMELLRFYSWAPNPRYDTWIDEIRGEMASLPVICPSDSGMLQHSVADVHGQRLLALA